MLIRADSGLNVGIGHLMRCLALAQAWQASGGKAVFATTENSRAGDILRSKGMEFFDVAAVSGSSEDAALTAEMAGCFGVNWIVIDGYRFDTDYQRRVKKAGRRLFCLDDYGQAEHYYADLILNQNLQAHDSLYVNREPDTGLLLGPRYVLLREEFLEWSGREREIKDAARRVLITLGGSDPNNVTRRVVQGLQRVEIEGLEGVVVVGPSNPFGVELEASLLGSGRSVRLERDVANMPELMTWADVAVSGAGSTCWELAFMGTPFITIILAENQEPIAESLSKTGGAVSAGWYHELTPETLAEQLVELIGDRRLRVNLSRRGREIVDGRGAARVSRFLEVALS